MEKEADTLSALVFAVAHSPIVLQRPAPTRLPAGFDELDLAILDWIAGEGFELRRRCRLM